MRTADLRALTDLSIAELQTRARETKEELFNLRFQLRTGHLSDFSKIKQIRRQYAQIQTLITQKRMAEAKHGAA